MSIYELPKSKKNTDKQFFKKTWNIVFLVFIFAISVLVGLYIGQELLFEETPQVVENNVVVQEEYLGETDHERAVISVVEKSMPSVVSVIVKKNLSEIYFNYFGEDALEQIGAGTGFIVSEDGLIITNKHVVEDESAVYNILTNDGEEYDVEVLSKNPVQDIAILKIKNAEDKVFEPLVLGDSSFIKLGQTAIAIGNALGMYQNSISVGVISGLQRDVVARGNNGEFESLQDIIQTDAAINSGNSGGPLLNLKGEVIAINTAVYLDSENIGFAVPINKAKRDLEQVRSEGKISYPFIGIRYITLNEEYSQELELSVNNGAFIVEEEDGAVSIVEDSPAEKAGLQEKDIILEVDGQIITEDNNLVEILQDYYPGETITLKVLRDGEELMVALTLADWNDF